MKKKYVITVLLICICMMLTAGCAGPQKKGTEALESGDYEEAMTQFEEASQSDDRKTSAGGYLGLGIAQYETGDYKSALESFQTAVDKGTEQTVQLYHLMGACAMQASDYETALEYIQAGLTLADSEKGGEQPDEEMIREMKYNEIVCCEQLADWETALSKAEAYAEDNPDDQDIQRELEFLKTR